MKAKANCCRMAGAALAVAAICGGSGQATPVPDGLAAGRLDPGGLSLDFAAISHRRFEAGVIPVAGDAGNLLPPDSEADPLPCGYGRWHPVACFNTEALPADSPYRRRIGDFAAFTNADGVLSAHLGTEFEAFCSTGGVANLYRRAETTWRKYVRLPDARGGRYRVSFRFRTRHVLPQDSIFALVLLHAWNVRADGKGYVHVKSLGAAGLEGGYHAWTPTFFDFEVPAGADVVSLQLRHDGVGDFHCKDVFLVRRLPDGARDPVSVRLSPAQLLDSAFAVGAGQCAHLTWEWKDESGAPFDAADTRFVLRLPKGFEFLGDTFAADARVEKTADGGSSVSFAVKDARYFPRETFQSWDKPAMLIASAGVAGTDGEMSLDVVRRGRRLGGSGPIRLMTVPAVKAASPTRFLYSAKFGTDHTASFRQQEACARFARHLAEIGLRLLAGEGKGWATFAHAETYRREFRAAGGLRLVAGSTVQNVYHVEDGHDIPAEDKFVPAPDLPAYWQHYVARDSACPLTFIEERPTFHRRILPPLRKMAEGYDGVRANWEPFMYLHQGCFCEKCRAKFARVAGIDEKELAADWPAIVRVNGRYLDRWMRFRSVEHGEILRVLDKYVKSWTGGERSLGFIPGITWRELNSAWRELRPSPESEPYDYGSFVTTFGAWGPYVMWDAERPYCYSKRLPLNHFVTTKDVREQTDRDYPEGRRPRLFGDTQGIQCGEWVTRPEWLEMAMDSFFFNRFDGAQAYFFPEGLDARYEAGLARSAARAARYESAVFDGVRNDAAVDLRPVREYAVPSTTVTDYLPKYRDVPMLQKAVYDANGARTVAVLNFWERGEAFFRLGTRVGDGPCALVDERGILYAKDAAHAGWTKEELAAGVLLQVGACRTRVFEVRPAGKGMLDGVTGVILAAEMAAAYEAARPRLEKAAAEDAAYEAAEGGGGGKDAKAEI